MSAPDPQVRLPDSVAWNEAGPTRAWAADLEGSSTLDKWGGYAA